MLQEYKDIIDRIPDEPIWFDECGVPRYVLFHPSFLNNVYADEALLLEVNCQECGAVYRMAVSRDRYTDCFNVPGGQTLLDIFGDIDYFKDPPCFKCLTGRTMTSVLKNVLGYWVFDRKSFEWIKLQ